MTPEQVEENIRRHGVPDIERAGELLQLVSDKGLLRTYAALTHRIHSVERKRPRSSEGERLALGLRDQRDAVETEILGRMS